MPKVLGFCVLVFFGLESFVFAGEQVTNSRKLTTEFEVVDVLISSSGGNLLSFLISLSSLIKTFCSMSLKLTNLCGFL